MNTIKCGIYKITNIINNHAYIGKSVDIDRRFREHRGMKYKSTLYDAFQKYGINNFSFEILELCSKEELNEKEIYWISYYDTYNNGYNETRGGEGGYDGSHRKPVAQYDLDGNFIAAYESIAQAERFLNIKAKTSSIGKVCNNDAYESNGFQWRFIQNEVDYTLNIGKSPLKKVLQEASQKSKINRVYPKTAVAQCDKDTHKIIKIFNSIKEASVETNIILSNIYRTIKNERKSAGGYYWIEYKL